MTAPTTVPDYDARIEAMRAEERVELALFAAQMAERAKQIVVQCDRETARLRPAVAGAA